MGGRQTINYLSITANLTIAYQTISGNDRLPTLVFLHEGLGCIAMWRDFPEQLCARLGCPGLIYDRQGYGNSSPLSRRRTIHYLHDYALKELPAVIAHLIPDRRIIIVGHSDGGSIGLIYAAEKDPNLVAVITEAAHVCLDSKTLNGIRTTVESYDAGHLQGLEKYHGTKTKSIFNFWSQTWLSSWFQTWNLEYLLPSIDCPVLVIQGMDDHYGEAVQAEKICRGVGQQCWKYMINDCGHVPHNEQKNLVFNKIVHFIREQIIVKSNI